MRLQLRWRLLFWRSSFVFSYFSDVGVDISVFLLTQSAGKAWVAQARMASQLRQSPSAEPAALAMVQSRNESLV
jgi:hypothetical protein